MLLAAGTLDQAMDFILHVVVNALRASGAQGDRVVVDPGSVQGASITVPLESAEANRTCQDVCCGSGGYAIADRSSAHCLPERTPELDLQESP